MAFSGGTFSRLYDWTTDRDAGVKIRADKMDDEMDGMATGLSTCLLKDGTQTATAKVPLVAGLSILADFAGTVGGNNGIDLGAGTDASFGWDGTNPLLIWEDSNTAAMRFFDLNLQSTGTPANGIGVGLRFKVETAADNTEIGASLDVVTTDVTSTAEDFDVELKVMGGGSAAATVMKWEGDTGHVTIPTGDLILNGANPEILGNDTDGVTYISAGTTTILGGSIRLYGDTHATKAQDIEFYADATLVGGWDESAGAWDFNNIDGTIIGATTVAAGSFAAIVGTTCTLSGVLSVDDTTDSTSGTTGSFHTDGGLGVVKDIVTDATVKALGDTATADAAAFGYTSTEGAILAGQGSTNDVTLKNDADENVLSILTGTKTVDLLASGLLSFGGVSVLSDSSGTMTLSNIDALDATTTTTLKTGVGGWVHIATVTASGAASADFDAQLSSTYDQYVIIGNDINPATDGVFLYLRTDTNGGASWDTTDYDWNTIFNADGTTPLADHGQVEGQIRLSGNTDDVNTLGNAADEGSFLILWIMNPAGTTYSTMFYSQLAVAGDSNTTLPHITVGRQVTLGAIDSVQLYMSSGTLDGTFRLYGIRNS